MATQQQKATPPKTTPRKPRPAASRTTKLPRTARANTRLTYDVVGVSLVAMGLIFLLTLFAPGAGVSENFFGRMVVHGFYLLAGIGAWVFPVVLIVLGGMLILGKSRSYDNMAALVGLFLVFVSWWHLLNLGRVGVTDIKYHFALDNLRNGGGYLGGGVSWCLRMLVGTIGAQIVFFALAVIGVVLVVDMPLPALLGPLERFVSEWTRRGGEAAVREVKRAASDAKATVKKANGKERERRPLVTPPPTAVYKRQTPEPLTNDDDDDTTDEAPTMPAGRGTPIPVQPALFHFRRAKPEPEEAEEEAVAPPPVAPEVKPRRTVAVAPVTPSGPFSLPSTDILRVPEPIPVNVAEGASEERRQIILQTLEDFGIGADIADIAYGPTITRYEIALERGIKVSKIVSLADNLAMSLAAMDVRVEAPIPGKSAIGIEVPSDKPRMVTIRECLEAPEFKNAPGPLTFVLGRDVTGTVRVADLAKMPHLLIGGSTGSGKSVGLNTLITSLLYRNTPRELKLLMIDPKKVELSLYEGIPHLASPVITNVKMAPSLFKQAIREMETRYDKFAKVGARNIESYNNKVDEEEKIPYWVILVDELADLMITSGPEIETAIMRLAQLARATGIHLVIATQRPSVNVITGTIKANISSRIAFAVNSAVDSRTILDQTGADRLIGRGDMLFMPMDAAKPIRIQGCFVSEAETETLVDVLKAQGQPHFDVLPSTLATSTDDDSYGNSEPDDDLFESAVRLVVTGGSASTSMLQRRFKVGYTRAARLIDLMEERGIVGALEGAKPREILVGRDEIDAMFEKTGVFE